MNNGAQTASEDLVKTHLWCWRGKLTTNNSSPLVDCETHFINRENKPFSRNDPTAATMRYTPQPILAPRNSSFGCVADGSRPVSARGSQPRSPPSQVSLIPLALIPPFSLLPFSSVRAAADLFIKTTSGTCQSLARSQGDGFFHPRCSFYNDQPSVVFTSRAPHISSSCHYGVQRINLTAQAYSSLSDSSRHQIYVIAAGRSGPIPQ